MSAFWMPLGPTGVAAFLASLVEFVEALTIVLAVGSVRGWRWALTGSLSAVAVLAILVALLGTALSQIPLHLLRLGMGILLLLFGLRWLRKAILRAAGIIPLHDETAAFARETDRVRSLASSTVWDAAAFAATFQITMLEGLEVVFIVAGIGAGGSDLMMAASLGAGAALALVIGLGAALHRPLASVPENALKFIVGVLMSSFGTFWIGEGSRLQWPGDEWASLALGAGFLAMALLGVRLCRERHAALTIEGVSV